MTPLFAAQLFATITGIIALIHFGWAANVLWPFKTEADLARAVAGFKGIDRMPPRPASVTVGILLLGTSGVVLTLQTTETASIILPLQFATGLISLTFLLRGIAAFTKFWATLTPEQPFRTYDRVAYGPLCLILSVLSLSVLTYSL